MDWDEYESDKLVECEVCGWKGTTQKAVLKMPDYTVAELYCPKCKREIDLIDLNVPVNKINEKAANGDTWWQNFLKIQESIEKSLLTSIDKLPDLKEHKKLEFIWDAEVSKKGEVWTVIRLKDGKVLWKEKAYYGGKQRFKEVEKLLNKKYGKRFVSFKINFDNNACCLYWYGD